MILFRGEYQRTDGRKFVRLSDSNFPSSTPLPPHPKVTGEPYDWGQHTGGSIALAYAVCEYLLPETDDKQKIIHKLTAHLVEIFISELPIADDWICSANVVMIFVRAAGSILGIHEMNLSAPFDILEDHLIGG